MRMRLSVIAFACAGLLLSVLNLTPAQAWDRGGTDVFAILPDGATGPEGLAVGPDRTAMFTSRPSASIRPARFPASGNSTYSIRPDTSSGRRASPVRRRICWASAFTRPPTRCWSSTSAPRQVLKVDPHTGASTVFMTVTTTPGSTGLNALTFDAAGNVYVSDSFNGIIWKTGPDGGVGSIWKQDPLLTTAGVPPFGANGLGFNKAGNALFVANTGNDTVVKIPVTGGNRRRGRGLRQQHQRRRRTGARCARQSLGGGQPGRRDRRRRSDRQGHRQARRFQRPRQSRRAARVDISGEPRLQQGRQVSSTSRNLTLDLRLFNPTFVSVDSQWASNVKHYTISRIRAVIPRLPYDDNGHHDGSRP